MELRSGKGGGSREKRSMEAKKGNMMLVIVLVVNAPNPTT